MGRTDIEDALKRLDRLTQEEARMASAQLLKVTNTIDKGVRGIADNVVVVDNRVAGVDDRVKEVNDQVKEVNDQVKSVGDVVQAIDDKITAVINGTHCFNQLKQMFNPNSRRW